MTSDRKSRTNTEGFRKQKEEYADPMVYPTAGEEEKTQRSEK